MPDINRVRGRTLFDRAPCYLIDEYNVQLIISTILGLVQKAFSVVSAVFTCDGMCVAYAEHAEAWRLSAN